MLLCTEAPAASVICAPHLLGDNYGEAEYLVDRRRLGRVWLLRRYPQKAIPPLMTDIAMKLCKDCK